MFYTFKAGSHNSTKNTTITHIMYPKSISFHRQTAKHNLDAVIVAWWNGDIHLPNKIGVMIKGKYNREKTTGKDDACQKKKKKSSILRPSHSLHVWVFLLN